MKQASVKLGTLSIRRICSRILMFAMPSQLSTWARPCTSARILWSMDIIHVTHSSRSVCAGLVLLSGLYIVVGHPSRSTRYTLIFCMQDPLGLRGNCLVTHHLVIDLSSLIKSCNSSRLGTFDRHVNLNSVPFHLMQCYSVF